jgi:hypothetical protein
MAEGDGDDGTVPRSALIREREKRTELETQMAAMRTELDGLKTTGQSELEKAQQSASRAQADVAKAQAERDASKAALELRDRREWTRDALIGLKVPSDRLSAAVKLVDLEGVEDEGQAAKAAAAATKSFPFLLEGAPAPPRLGTPGGGGQPGNGASDRAKPMLDDKGQPTEEYKRGLGSFLQRVAGLDQAQQGQ